MAAFTSSTDARTGLRSTASGRTRGGADIDTAPAPTVHDEERSGTAARPGRSTSRLALLGIIGLAALLYTWNIGYSGFSTYYAAAAKSMALDPRAFLFGALDPGATLTLDKLSGFVVPQALAIDLFGFHAWALSLPQAIEGVVTVAAGYVIGRRWRGERYGLGIAGLLAVTPMLAAMFGRPMEDGMLTMCEVLAFAATQRAIRTGRLLWLLVAAVWVAIGFQAKMLQAWLLLPALLLAYLVGGPIPIRARLRHVIAAAAVCVLLSVLWMSAIQSVPAMSRPYIDGTTNDDIFSMVFGYNGFDRLIPGAVPGAVPQLHAAGTGQSLGSGTRTGGSGTSVFKLLLPQFTTQIGWLYPAVLAGACFLAADLRRVRRGSGSQDPRLFFATALGLIAWLLMAVGVLSLAFVPHATYFAVIALPLAALTVHGWVRAIEEYGTGRPGRRLLLPLLVAVQSAWSASIIEQTVPQLRILAPAVLVLGGLATIALILTKEGRHRPVRTPAILAGALALLLGPISWSAMTLGSGGGGSASDAFAGPRIGLTSTLPLIGLGGGPGLIHLHRPFTGPSGYRFSAADQHLVRYVTARNRAGAIPFASDSLPVVVSTILGTRTSPLPMGGFSKQAPEPTIATLHGLVTTGRLRYVLLVDPTSTPPPPANPTVQADRTWVRTRCRNVLTGRFRDRHTETQTLFDCSGAAS